MGGKAGGGWGAEGSQEGVECATHVHTCPLLRSAWLEEWEREAEEWVVWAGGSGVGRVYRCSCVCVLGQHVNAGPLGRAVRAVQGCHHLFPGSAHTLGCPRRLLRKLCLVAWHAGSLPPRGNPGLVPLPGNRLGLEAHPLGLGPGGPVGERAGVTLELPGQGALILRRAVLPRQPESSRVHSTQLKRDLGICSRFKQNVGLEGDEAALEAGRERPGPYSFHTRRSELLLRPLP